MDVHSLPTLNSSVASNPRSRVGVVRSGLAVHWVSQHLAAFTAQAPKAAQTRQQGAIAGRPIERRTTTACQGRRSNRALLTDTYTSPLRAQRGAAKRER